MSLKRVGAYLRCSTKEQSTEMQRFAIAEYLKARGYDKVEFYEDQGKSGTSAKNRTEFARLMKDAKARQLDTVICYKLDRWFRSLREATNTLHELHELGVAFVSVKDSLDFTTSAGRLMTQLLMAFAEFEASIIKERIHSGLAVARSKGKHLGRPQKTIDADTITRLSGEGMSVRQISQRLAVSPTMVYRVVKGKRTGVSKRS